MAVQANIELVGGIPTRDQKVVAAQQRYGGRQRSLYKAVVERAFQKGIERFQRDPIILPREGVDHSPQVLRQGVEQAGDRFVERSEEHTSELQSLMRISYAVFC